jgi:hypothetical protein
MISCELKNKSMITEEMLNKARHIIKLHNSEQLIIHGVMHLLPCPFCNGKAKTRTTTFGDSMTDNYTVECENGHSLDNWSDTEIEAIGYWNDRQ